MKSKIILFLLLSIFTLSTSVNTDARTNTETTAIQKKKKSNRKVLKKKRKNRVPRRSAKCTYNGHQLYVGPRGGCYYYAGNSKEYVDRGYCASCN